MQRWQGKATLIEFLFKAPTTTLHKESILFRDGAEPIDLREGICLKGRAAAKEAVNVGLLEEILGVLLVGRAAVLNAHSIGHFSRHIGSQPCADVGVCLLCHFRGSGQAGPDGPHWLVRNHNLGVVLGVVADRLELRNEHVHGLARLAVVLLLANARRHRHAELLALGDFGAEEFVGLAKDVAALRVADERPLDAHVQQHGHRRLPRVGPLLFLEHVLGRGLELGLDGGGDHVHIDGGGRHIDLATGLGCRVEAVHKLLDRSLGDAIAGVQLPVSAHDWHAGRHATAGDGLGCGGDGASDRGHF
mmetsp:Transcript_45594/g.92039  ORF Transcript_45594/g.92039 Transcript_45594/m.92039 type:complete len:304 (-) Transcript_45594:23-934(-)